MTDMQTETNHNTKRVYLSLFCNRRCSFSNWLSFEGTMSSPCLNTSQRNKHKINKLHSAGLWDIDRLSDWLAFIYGSLWDSAFLCCKPQQPSSKEPRGPASYQAPSLKPTSQCVMRFHRRVWNRALSLRYACIWSLGIEKNRVLTHSLTHPAYLMPWEPKRMHKTKHKLTDPSASVRTGHMHVLIILWSMIHSKALNSSENLHSYPHCSYTAYSRLCSFHIYQISLPPILLTVQHTFNHSSTILLIHHIL